METIIFKGILNFQAFFFDSLPVDPEHSAYVCAVREALDTGVPSLVCDCISEWCKVGLWVQADTSQASSAIARVGVCCQARAITLSLRYLLLLAVARLSSSTWRVCAWFLTWPQRQSGTVWEKWRGARSAFAHPDHFIPPPITQSLAHVVSLRFACRGQPHGPKSQRYLGPRCTSHNLGLQWYARAARIVDGVIGLRYIFDPKADFSHLKKALAHSNLWCSECCFESWQRARRGRFVDGCPVLL